MRFRMAAIQLAVALVLILRPVLISAHLPDTLIHQCHSTKDTAAPILADDDLSLLDDSARSQVDSDTIRYQASTPTENGFVVRNVLRLRSISVAEFENTYSRPDLAVPIVFEHLMDDVWDESQWTREAAVKNCGTSKLIDESEDDCDGPSAGADEDCHPVRFVNQTLLGKEWSGLSPANLDELDIATVEDFLKLQDTPEGHNLYLHDCPVLRCCPLAASKLRVPKYFTLDYRYLENDPDLVGKLEANRFHFPSVFIGKKGSGSPLHNDADMSRFWVHLLSGKKLWRIFPPSENWRLYAADEDEFYPSIFSSDAMNPDFAKYPDLRGALVYETIMNAGDVLFVPEGWAHQVSNLEDSISTTMNFVDWHGLNMHLQYREATVGKDKYAISYFHRLMTSFLMPLDSNNKADKNIDFDKYFSSLHLSSMDVPASVKHWVKARSKWPRAGIDTYRTHDGFPALHLAVSANFVSVIQYLLDNGADINLRDYRGRTAMDLAKKLGHKSVIELLDSHNIMQVNAGSGLLYYIFRRIISLLKRWLTDFLALFLSGHKL